MISQVYYRKWRPRALGEVVGQGPITQTLKRAMIQERLSHAYLFCGPRGTGKTSTARILSKAVNCPAAVDGEPCNVCHMCESIDQGKALDLIEVDAASHRGIDEIRNIRDKVHFVPSEASYKVYIIDEVHMLTEPAFNALLKTLEEPPPHVIFILATTESQKLPATIISRCQRFDFRRIATLDIVSRLGALCDAEGVQVDQLALQAIARSSMGSLRDAENLLEQLVVAHGTLLTVDKVHDLLGVTQDSRAIDLVKQVIVGELTKGLETISIVASEGADLRRFHRQVVEYLRCLLLVKAGASQAIDYPSEVLDEIKSLAPSTRLDRIAKILKILAKVDLRQDNLMPLPIELALVECYVDSMSEQGQITQENTHNGKSLMQAKESTSPTPKLVPRVAEAVYTPKSDSKSQSRYYEDSVARPMQAKAIGPDAPWDDMVKAFSRYKGRKYFIGPLLRESIGRRVEGDTIVLTFRHRSHMERLQEEMDDPQTRRTVQEALAKAVGSSYPLEIALSQEEVSTSSKKETGGYLIRAAIEMGGRVIQETKEIHE